MSDIERSKITGPDKVTPYELASFLSRGEIKISGGIITQINPLGEQVAAMRLVRTGGGFLDITCNAYLTATLAFEELVSSGSAIKGITDWETFRRNAGGVHLQYDNLVRDSLASIAE